MFREIPEYSRFSRFVATLTMSSTQNDEAEMELGLRVTGHQVSDFCRVGSGHGSVSDPVFDPIFSFNMRVYCGIVSTE